MRKMTKNDVVITMDGQEQTITHADEHFAPIHCDSHNPKDLLVEINQPDENGLRIMLDTINIYYFVVNDMVVLGEPCKSYDKAVEMLEYWTRHYSEWSKNQSAKELSKNKFLDEVKSGNLMAKLIHSDWNWKPKDEHFYPLAKIKGRGSVDIVRNNMPSAIFYIDSLSSCQMIYTGDKLKIFSAGYILYNEKEITCIMDWEKKRDREAEWADLISDGSREFYRKKDFFESRGCGHLRKQTYSLLVRDNNIRQSLVLEY